MLLSYANDLVLVVTDRGNQVTWVQQALDLVSDKCKELGLKISTEKSKAMMMKTAFPDCHLRTQGIRLAWTNSHRYLGVWVDRSLTFTTQPTYLRERTQARINVMRAMTRTHTGATSSVLRLFYVLAVRALVDYSAPVLVALSPTQQKRIEVIQNQAMRTVLGAPHWISGCVMQAETRLVPLAARTQQIVAFRMAKVLHQDRKLVARTRLCRVLPQWQDLFTGNTWLLRMADVPNHLVIGGVRDGPDCSAATYVAPPPWQPPLAEITFTTLPATKVLYLQEEMRQHALQAVAQAVGPGTTIVYYTDGSVDPERGPIGAAVVTGDEVLSWRTPDYCSTLQTEMVAIQHALHHAQHRPTRGDSDHPH